MKLHLGCGERYLPGYMNIDFPLSSHSVQEKSVADLQTDILNLRYASGSIEEIRLHHVFEHFPRPIACALLAGWFSWLKNEGILHIEVPDFKKTAKRVLNPFVSFRMRAVAERHLFGSHEAAWAVHCEGYTADMLKRMLATFGYNVQKIKHNSFFGTYNIEFFAKKASMTISRSEYEGLARDFLKNYLVGSGENRLLEVWMINYNKQVEKCWADEE